jgi:small subunit ribosomal protein S16
MLTIRLSRIGRKNLPFFRIVLTDHRLSAKKGYKEVLGWHNPTKHESQLNVDRVLELVSNGAQMSERAAKIAFKQSNDETFKKFIIVRDRTRTAKD